MQGLIRTSLAMLLFTTACGEPASPQFDGGLKIVQDAGSDAGTDAGTDAGSTADAGVEPAVAYCERLCAHDTACAPEDTHDSCDTERCKARAELFREVARDALSTCLTVDCAVNEDACFTQAAQSAGTRPVDETFRTECATRRADCANAFTAGLCESTNGTEIFVAEVVEAGRACLTEACGDVFNCVITAWGGPK